MDIYKKQLSKVKHPMERYVAAYPLCKLITSRHPLAEPEECYLVGVDELGILVVWVDSLVSFETKRGHPPTVDELGAQFIYHAQIIAIHFSSNTAHLSRQKYLQEKINKPKEEKKEEAAPPSPSDTTPS